jgi:hypothetical protein
VVKVEDDRAERRDGIGLLESVERHRVPDLGDRGGRQADIGPTSVVERDLDLGHRVCRRLTRRGHCPSFEVVRCEISRPFAARSESVYGQTGGEQHADDQPIVGSANALWFNTTGGVGRITAHGHSNEFFVREARSVGYEALATGPDSKIWFLEDGGPTAVGRLDPRRLTQLGELSAG